MRRILLVVYEAYARDSRVRRHSRALAAAGYAVEVLAVDDGKSEAAARADGVTFSPLGRRKYRGQSKVAYIGAYIGFTLRAFLAITRRVVAGRVGVVYVNNPPDFLVYAAIAARMRGIPVVLDVHDMFSDLYGAKFTGRRGLLSWIIPFVERRSFRFADGLLTIHDIYRERIAAIVQGDVPVAAVWNVPDAEGWVEIGDARLGESHGNGVLRLGHHGTIVERFGTDLAVAAVAELRRRGRDVRLHILGDGDFADRLQARIAELGVGDVVRFERRSFVADELPGFASSIDVGVAPYEPSPFSEHGLPTKVLEYLALGVPTIVTGTEMLRTHLDGAVRIVSGTSAGELADAIDELRDPEIRRRHREAGRPLARRYDWKSQRGQLLALVDGMLDQRTGSRRVRRRGY